MSVAALRPGLDPASRAWLAGLRASGATRDAALASLHAILLREARYEVRRRTARLAHPSGRDLDELAVQAADDALVAVLAKLGEFRGDALFTTWARRFAALEVPGEIRRRLGHARELPTSSDDWPAEQRNVDDVVRCVESRELARALSTIIRHDLSARQRDVLLALALEGTSARELAAHLSSNPGALYKTLHDARVKLRSRLDRAWLAGGEASVHGARRGSCPSTGSCRKQTGASIRHRDGRRLSAYGRRAR